MLPVYLNTKHPARDKGKGLQRWLGLIVILLFAIYLVPSAAQAQSNITRLEYYIDTDPGFGSATAVSVTPLSTDIQNKVIPVNPASVGVGVHRLYVRAQNALGNWGLTNTLLFYKPYGSGTTPPTPPAPTNITRVEYYMDIDPGFGNATNLTIAASTNIQDVIIPINPSTLNEGVHRLYVRARNANGNWSLTNTWLFYKPYGNGIAPPAPAIAQMSKLEYYIDNDPGYGNGVPVALDSLTNFADYVVPINVTGLTTGIHNLWVRGLDKNGKWGMMNKWLFSTSAVIAGPSIVVNSITDTTNCAADSFNVSFHRTGTYNAGNVFNVQLSDAAGSFTTPIIIGSYTGTGNAIVKVKLPSHMPEGVNYKIRVNSTNPVVTGVATAATITIHDRPTAQTITGLAPANGTEIWPYTAPAATGSTWNWIITNGVKTIGGITNNVSIQWAAGDSNIIKAARLNVIETSQYGCVGDTSTKLVNIYKLKIRNVLSATMPCPKDSVTITVNTDGVFYVTPAANQLIAELSNGTGVFTTPTATANFTSGAITGNNLAAGSIKLGIPGNLPNGNNYRIRVRSSNPVFIGDTSVAISIQKPNLGANLTRVKCEGAGYDLRTNFTDAVLTYAYYNNAFILLNRPDSVDAGVYNVIGTNANGCTDTALVTLTNNPKPNLGADITVYHICPNETTSLVPLYNTTGLTAIWNTANVSAAPPGTYRLIVTNTFGCTDTAFANVVLEVATWTGTTSNSWHVAANWSTNKVPTQQTHVIIPAGTPNVCTVSSADAVAASIQVRQAAATIQVNSGRKLLIVQKCGLLPVN
jgi:hypothetical protein